MWSAPLQSLEKLWSKIRRRIERVNKWDVVQFGLRAALLPRKVRCLQVQEQQRSPGTSDVVLLSVMRNAAPWLRGFLDHHRRLGVGHFVVLDNGSSDATVNMLRGQPDVTLLSTDVPYHSYENTMKRYLVSNFGRNRWCLFVDADELFDWPLRDGRSIEKLIDYLEQGQFNAVVCQMLDLWSPRGLDQGTHSLAPQEVCRRYSLSGISKTAYPFWDTNTGRNSAIQMHWGGVRQTLFGTCNGLTKVSLFKAEPLLRPFHMWHHVLNARIADFTCVLYHYHFAAGFAERVAEAVATRRYGYVTTAEYEAYHRALEREPSIPFEVPGARDLTGTDELIEKDFLVVSEAYVRRFR